MATAAVNLHTVKLPARKASAVRRRAQQLGLTPQEYLRQLIDEDLAVGEKARVTSLDELAAPFREALGGLSGEELDRRVKAARARGRNGTPSSFGHITRQQRTNRSQQGVD